MLRSLVYISIVMLIGSLLLWLRSIWIVDEIRFLTRADTLFVLDTHPNGVNLMFVTHANSYPPTWNPQSSIPARQGWSYSNWHEFMLKDSDGDGIGYAPYLVLQNAPAHSFPETGYEFTTCNWSYPNGTQIVQRLICLALPFWLIVPLLMIPGLLGWRWTRARRSRMRANRCISCGYDLRGSPGRCPECGRTVSPNVASSAHSV